MMDQTIGAIETIEHVIYSYGWYGPAIFIALHVVRSFMFIPVTALCIAGGILFHGLFGTIYSMIGLSIGSVILYVMFIFFPLERYLQKKKKVISEPLSLKKVILIRLVPFAHYNLVSLWIKRETKRFPSYFKFMLLSNIPFVMIYSFLGEVILLLSYEKVALITLMLILIIYLVWRQDQKIKVLPFKKEATQRFK
jgi:uncharacterized membrane protein YdjX (TVP38/TMEM64 family)